MRACGGVDQHGNMVGVDARPVPGDERRERPAPDQLVQDLDSILGKVRGAIHATCNPP
jgi:hypothetical protein